MTGKGGTKPTFNHLQATAKGRRNIRKCLNINAFSLICREERSRRNGLRKFSNSNELYR